jgi:hypothetical protein
MDGWGTVRPSLSFARPLVSRPTLSLVSVDVLDEGITRMSALRGLVFDVAMRSIVSIRCRCRISMSSTLDATFDARTRSIFSIRRVLRSMRGHNLVSMGYNLGSIRWIDTTVVRGQHGPSASSPLALNTHLITPLHCAATGMIKATPDNTNSATACRMACRRNNKPTGNTLLYAWTPQLPSLAALHLP